jgi:hypothetical protein
MNSSSPPETAKKRRSTSIPLVLGVVILGGLAYYFDVGLHVMTYVMYQQEKAKSASYMEDAKKQAKERGEDGAVSQEELKAKTPEIQGGPGKPPEDEKPAEELK